MGFTKDIPSPGGGFQSRLLIVDALVASIIAATFYFAPDRVADFIFQRKTDGVHWHLVRCVGGQILAGAFVNIRLRNSKPQATTVCCLLRIISSILCLLIVFHSRSQTPQLVHPQVLEVCRVVLFSIIFVYISVLIYNGWAVDTTLFPENKVGNFLYQLDCLASIAIGTAWLTFPKWLLHRQVAIPLDESHELLGRVMGAFFVSSYCISQHALHWSNNRDRVVVIYSRVVCCAAILSAQVYSQYAYHDDWNGNHWVGITLFSTWTIIAFIYGICILCSKESPKGKMA